ncbi:hypothetical protein JFU58_09825 [Pseudomonas sp. TH34]|uniref:restriction endonuclease n=1 Tax=Pseudomonas sp. TH34 TaxID=2796399 RepID=UPI0019140E13|nr:restriction endonuclease [Pseudomonas sp. TH34]MBK5408837.1 hypothetical protein [Pseudomonas sp. TH34]
MALLDFSEIPPSKSPSTDVDAFEKFARDFFVTIFSAVVEKTVGRGPDDGADLVIRVGAERWLVSCKNYTNGSVPRSAEDSPLGDMQQWGCQKFIGFYAPAPSSGLEAKLRQTKDNNPSFNYQIFDSDDIERHLISTVTSAGWILAFRWFPRSYPRIASSLVLPVAEFGPEHVLTEPGASRIAGLHTTVRYCEDNLEAANAAAEDLVSFANELATEKAFSSIFMERIKEFCLVVPGSFLRPAFVADDAVCAQDLYPSWDIDLIRTICTSRNRYGLKSLCVVWSFWSLNLAQAVYCYGRTLIDKDVDISSHVDEVSPGDFAQAVANYEKSPGAAYRVRGLRDALSLADITSSGRTAERGYFASLLCFFPSGLSAGISREYALTMLAMALDEEQQLTRSIRTLVASFDADDQTYVEARGVNLHELLISVNVIDTDYFEKVPRLDPLLKCASTRFTETWIPAGPVNASVAEALGFR